MSQQNEITDEEILNLTSLIGNMNINNNVEDNMVTDNNSTKTEMLNYNYFYNLFGPDFKNLDKSQQKLKIYNYLVDYFTKLYNINSK